MESTLFPPMVFTVWWIGLAITVVVLVPTAVYMLYSLWRTVQSIRLYASESLTAAAGIVEHTSHVAALDATVATASEILTAAEAVSAKLETIANVLARRAGAA
jgi:hypothetical protein